ncbi:MAG: hypothetical protein K2L55_08655 [Muribaculaceae bacterium]|nr:hypothetical protein [Muribaculaceae bacterium]
MKKIAVLICALFPALSAFAYYGDYGYSRHDDDLSGFAIFTLVVVIAYIILSIVVLIRWWKMTSNVEQIRQHITHANPKLTYLVAIGEKEQAQKAALTMLVDILYPIYFDQYNHSKADDMNKEIQARLPKIQKLGLSVPDYVTTGENFIDYINGLTDGKVPYKDANNPCTYN